MGPAGGPVGLDVATTAVSALDGLMQGPWLVALESRAHRASGLALSDRRGMTAWRLPATSVLGAFVTVLADSGHFI